MKEKLMTAIQKQHVRAYLLTLRIGEDTRKERRMLKAYLNGMMKLTIKLMYEED